jgi:hypothetical protein
MIGNNKKESVQFDYGLKKRNDSIKLPVNLRVHERTSSQNQSTC